MIGAALLNRAARLLRSTPKMSPKGDGGRKTPTATTLREAPGAGGGKSQEEQRTTASDGIVRGAQVGTFDPMGCNAVQT